jgi:hypothetical protein
LGNEELLGDLVKLAAGGTVSERVTSRIDAIAAAIPWEEPEGWEWDIGAHTTTSS